MKFKCFSAKLSCCNIVSGESAFGESILEMCSTQCLCMGFYYIINPYVTFALV